MLHTNGRGVLRHLLCLTTLALTGPAVAQVWLNETGQPLECDYCLLWGPPTTIINVNSEPLYGVIWEAGLTETPGPNPSILAQVGIGPLGSDPRTATGWTWHPAYYVDQWNGNDMYGGAVQGTAMGMQSYTFRFSLDGGSSFTLADLNGAGSVAGYDFSPAELGIAAVTDAVPEPGTLALWLAGLAVVGGIARRTAGRSTG